MLVTVCTAALSYALPAKAQTEFEPIQNPYNKEFYQNITYQWTDEQGVSHTSTLADRADSYPQIVELLKEVYANPTVPGFVKDPVAYGVDFTDDPNTNVTVQYAPCEFAPYNMTGEVKTPVEGTTALLVELNDDYQYSSTATPEEMLRKIKAVSVLTHNLHIGDRDKSENPGWLFNYVGELNNFFIITKGCNRVPNNHPQGVAPFYMMYEEFSPSNKEPIYGAYDSMNSGSQFAVDHNCSSVLSQNHIISMSEKDAPQDYAMNFMFYLPDRRFAGDSRTANGTNFYEWYTYYSKDHMPFFFFNKIVAAINETPEVDANTKTATVKVEWTSSYKEVSKSEVPERFMIYRVVDDAIASEPLKTDEYELDPSIASIARKEADGSMISAADKCVILVKEHQEETTNEVRYIIKGRRYGCDFEWVESNIVTTVIPGTLGLEQFAILIDGNPKSQYNEATERNEYQNGITLTDQPNALGKRLLAKQIVAADPANGIAGSSFALKKYTADSTDPELVATMTVVKKYAKTWGDPDEGVWVYDAVITYPDGVSTEGLELTAQFKSKYNIKNTALDGDEPVVAVDKNAATHTLARFVDRFSADTHDGQQPLEYHYFIAFTSGAETVADNAAAEPAISNVIEVNVPRHELKVGYIPYTEEEIINDSDYSNLLAPNAPGIQFEVRSNPSIASFVVRDVTTGEDVVRASRTPSGTLTVSRMNAQGALSSYKDFKISDGSFIVVPVADPINHGDVYSLVIKYNNGNSYGNVRKSISRAPKPLLYRSQLMADPNATDLATTTDFYTWIKFSPEHVAVNASRAADADPNEFSTYGWRVWAKHDAADEYYPVSDSSHFPSDGDVYVEHTFDSNHSASEETPISVVHHARLYSQLPEALNLNGLPASESSQQPGFVVVDRQHTMTLNDNDKTVTGIDNVATDVNVTYRYFDVAGRPLNAANLPAGVIIKVGSDGSATKFVNR